jgi:hypothetical protein
MILIVLSPHLPASLPAGPGFAASHLLRWLKDGFPISADNQGLRYRVVALIDENSVSAVVDAPLRPDWPAGGERQIILTVEPKTRLRKEPIMDREHVKGATEKLKGAVKDAAGKLTGDEKLQAEGKSG